MKKLCHILIAATFLLALLPAAALAHTEDDPKVVELLAGQTMDVGDVKVWNDGETLYIKYEVTDTDWCITETHLQVATSLEDIPQKNGNPIPGKFEENDEHDCVSEVLYTYNLADRGWSPDTNLFIAAHSVVQSFVGFEDPNLDNFATALPDQVTMSVQYPSEGGPAYFPVTTITGGTVLDGTYEGWCVDTDNVIYQNTNYTANVYSSYETPLPEGLVEYPENLDLVNWVINQGFVGQPSDCGGTYTYGDVQRAIWALIEDNQSTSGLGSWSQCRVDEIVAAAYASGEAFVPGCDDYVAVILQPVDGQQVVSIAQVTFASVGVPCNPLFQYETAWGDGDDFPGKNWATYFTYTVQEPCTNVPNVVNGSFETPVVGTSQGWDIYDSGTEGLGWTVEWYDGSTSYGGQTRPEPPHLELHKSGNEPNTSEIPDGWQANDGIQYAELDTDWDGPGGGLNNEPASVKIYQELQTCPGQDYKLKFSWANRPDSRVSKVQVFWNGTLVSSEFTGSGGSSTSWNDATFTVQATGETTRLEFIETGTADSYGMFLDSVSVEVPTP